MEQTTTTNTLDCVYISSNIPSLLVWAFFVTNLVHLSTSIKDMFGELSPPSICWPCGSHPKTTVSVASHESQFTTALYGSQTKTVFYEGFSSTATIFVKEGIAFSTLPHHGQEGVRENVYLVDERRKGWHSNSFHTLFFTQCSKTLKRYF